MNLPPSPYKFTVYGLKAGHRDPIIDHRTGDIVDDGQNHVILLGGGNDEATTDFFCKNVKANTKAGEWKIWIEKKK